MNEVLAAEAARISVRRAEAVRWGHLTAADASAPLRGLALSGGGIRAAFVARGLLEELAEKKQLAMFDYMSSVSGGGYAACMLTDHVGNLKKTAKFEDTYKLEAPPYQWWRVLFGVLIDPLLNLLPLLAYLCIFPIFLARKGTSATSANLLAVIVNLTLLTFILITWLYPKFRSPATNAERAHELNHVSIVMLSFIAPMTLTMLFGSVVILFMILAGMWASAAFVSARPHRYYRTPNPAFRWLLIALLGVVAGVIGPLLRDSLWAVLTLVLFVAGSFLSISVPLPRHNQLNLIFSAYQTAIAQRFLPFSSWLTGKRRLYDTGQCWNPYPILNASVATGATLESFELAPLYCGSVTTGFHCTRTWLPDVRLSDAMAISGGAVDFLRKTATLRSLLGTLLGGTEYWITSSGKAGGRTVISIARMQVAAGFAGGAALRLSDGGFVDNLGVLALVRRRVKYIVCLDATYDPEYQFDDLRRLCVQVHNERLAQLSIGGIACASEERRFRQNRSNILRGTLEYPATADHPAESGVYLHLKISPARVADQLRYPDFPHLTTLDQLLHAEEIEALRRLGCELAAELCSEAPC